MATESGTFVQPKCMRLCLNFNLLTAMRGMNLTQPLKYKYVRVYWPINLEDIKLN